MSLLTILLLCSLTVVHSHPDKVKPLHIIKTRSIDLNNAHGLAMETRLERTVMPTNYKLDLEPYLEDGVFKVVNELTYHLVLSDSRRPWTCVILAALQMRYRPTVGRGRIEGEKERIEGERKRRRKGVWASGTLTNQTKHNSRISTVILGHVSINITWLQDSDEISLHAAHDLEISNTEVRACINNSGETKQVIRRADSDPKKPIYTIRLEKPVPKDSKGHLDISFNGNMQTVGTEAFFKTTYITDNEVEAIVAATQLRPNNARRFFPCFDEPSYKTPFRLSVVRPRTMVALSNTWVARTEDITGEPNAVWDHFEETPPLSTYSVGLVIASLCCNLEPVIYQDEYKNKIEINVWSRYEYHTMLQDVAGKVLRIVTEVCKYWQSYIPLERLDIVALPNYQGTKPADNWGLIVLKESDLASRGYLQLAQEVLYQWLGGLTSPAWWTDAHLNKALVGFLAAEVTYTINNGIEMEGKWPMTMLYSLYYEFSKRYPHSRITGMKQETASTKIELIFRMFNYTLGRETFRKGLRTFLEEHKMKTFTGDDVWNALNTAAKLDQTIPKDVDVKTVAESWISKDRLPFITVQRNYEENTALVTQKAYLRSRTPDAAAARLAWWAPLVVARGDRPGPPAAPLAWLRANKDLNLVGLPDAQHYIIVNPEEIAPFLVNYDTRGWNMLLNVLQSENRTQIPELTRAKLLHDAWNLAYGGELSFATALNMTLFLKEERHHLVWDPLFTLIDHIQRFLSLSAREKFEQYAQRILTPLYEELSQDVNEDEESWRKNLRTLAKNFLCRVGYSPCVKEAREQFRKWMDAPNPDEGNPINNQYICPVFKWGNSEEWEFGLQRVINFPSSRKQSERTYLLKTLAGCPTSAWAVQRLLNVTMVERNPNFTETDIFLIASMLSGSSDGGVVLFSMFEDHWEFMKEKYANQSTLWNNLLSAATSHFTSQSGLKAVTKFYSNHKGEFGSAEHIMEKALKNIKVEAQWTDENLPVIEKWLDNYLANNPKRYRQLEVAN